MVTSKAMHLKAEWLFGKWHFSSQLQPPVAAHSHHCIIAMFEICTAQKGGLRLRWTHFGWTHFSLKSLGGHTGKKMRVLLSLKHKTRLGAKTEMDNNESGTNQNKLKILKTKVTFCHNKKSYLTDTDHCSLIAIKYTSIFYGEQ